MAIRTDGEKIVALQVQMEEVKSTGTRIEKQVNRLVDRFDDAVNTFVTRSELKVIIEKFETDVKRAKNLNWITHTLSAILGAFLVAIAYWIIAIAFHQGVK